MAEIATLLTNLRGANARPRRILVVRLQNHGDVLLTTPIFSALKRHIPGVEVDAMVYAETAPMIRANPDLDHIWAWQRGKQAGRGWKRLVSISGLLRRIRARRYDWILHLNDQWPGAVVAAISGAQLRMSYEMAKRDYWLWRRIFPVRIPFAPGHMVEQNLSVLRALGLPLDHHDARCRMAFSEDDANAAQAALTAIGVRGNYMVVHPGSRWFFKCWEDDRLAEVITACVRDGERVVLTAAPDPRELAMVESLLRRVNEPSVVTLAGRLTLPELAAVIAGAKLFLGVDSVPMHMAAALGTPLVALFGPTHVDIWRPWSNDATVIHAADFGPLIAPNDVDTSTTDRYLANIPVEPVLAAVRSRLASNAGVRAPRMTLQAADGPHDAGGPVVRQSQ